MRIVGLTFPKNEKSETAKPKVKKPETAKPAKNGD